jgi:hypothetical protein
LASEAPNGFLFEILDRTTILGQIPLFDCGGHSFILTSDLRSDARRHCQGWPLRHRRLVLDGAERGATLDRWLSSYRPAWHGWPARKLDELLPWVWAEQNRLSLAA